MDEQVEGDPVRASIIASHGQLFIRTTGKLYCVGKASRIALPGDILLEAVRLLDIITRKWAAAFPSKSPSERKQPCAELRSSC